MGDGEAVVHRHACDHCGLRAPRLIVLTLGDVELGVVCEPCEERAMLALAEKVGGEEGARGLRLWREKKARRGLRLVDPS